MGQVQAGPTYLSGRIGFQGEEETEIWDPEAQDFRPIAVQAGMTAPFVLSFVDGDLAFQTRSPTIRVQTFVGALQALLREATNEADWSVEPARRNMSLSEWRSSVARVVALRVHIERPNPNYEGRPDVQRLLEGADAVAGTVSLNSPDGLATDGDIVEQLLNHAERGYGSGSLTGERVVDGEIRTSVYDIVLGGESEVHERPTDENGDVPFGELVNELEQDEDRLDEE